MGDSTDEKCKGKAVTICEESMNFPTHKGNLIQLRTFVFHLSHIFKNVLFISGTSNMDLITRLDQEMMVFCCLGAC
jgi:hypothetical protein